MQPQLRPIFTPVFRGNSFGNAHSELLIFPLRLLLFRTTQLLMARVLSLFRPWPVLSLTGRIQPMLRKMSMDSRARGVFAAAVEAVQPDTVIRKSIERKDDSVIIDGHSFTLKRNLHLVGFGKAVLGMAAEAERILGDHLVKGIISVPNGIQQTLRQHGKE